MNQNKLLPASQSEGDCSSPTVCKKAIAEKLEHNEDRILELLEYSYEHLVTHFDALTESMKQGDDEISLEQIGAIRDIADKVEARCLKAHASSMFELIQNVAPSQEVNAIFAKVKTSIQGTLLSLKDAMGTEAVTAPDLPTGEED